MRFQTLAFAILLASMLAGSIAPAVGAQVFFVTVPQPHSSSHNEMIDFYAGGSSDAYSLRISPKGGSLSVGNYLTIGLMPWGYVTTKWNVGRIYIIFLVNVTETNFRIGFLYLTNSTSQPFLLRLFDYGGDNVNVWTFQGVQHVYNRTVATGAVELPTLRIPAAPKVTNGISVLGPQLYLTSRWGLLLNGTSFLSIYPLVNQFFAGPTDYNEVWSLLADNAGNYYFAILYMQNGDPSHVIIEHQVRLNDYRRLDGRTVSATWVKGSFENQVTVRTPSSNLTVKVNGFPFQTNKNGVFSTAVPKGTVTIEVPSEILDSTNSRLRFAGWSKYGTYNPLSIRVNSTLDVTAKYDHEYPLAVTSAYGNPQGSGWYLQGTNATFSVENIVDTGNGTRHVFEQWGGDSNSTQNQTWTIVNSPKNVVALWKTQYGVTLSATGLPANASAVVLVGTVPVTLTGSTPYTQWVDSNAPLPITVQSTQIQGSTENYLFSGLRVGNETLAGTIDVTKPVTISLVYTATPKLGIAISLQVSPPIAVPGFPFTITGSLSGFTSQPGVVEIQYNTANEPWREIAKAPVSDTGEFAYTWQPTVPGNYSIRAYWPGDLQHSSASQVVGVRVLDSSGPTVGGSDGLSQLIQSGLAAAKGVPYLSVLVSLTMSLMTLGYVLTAFVLPSASPIIGYLIGSIFVGFIFVFPICAAILLVKAARTRRGPSVVWLTPLLTIWIASLALVLLSPAFVTLQPLALASQILLVLSNTFVIPILTAYRLAKLVV